MSLVQTRLSVAPARTLPAIPAIEAELVEGRAPGLLRRLPSSRVAMVGLALVVFWVAVALLAPVLPLPSPTAQDYAAIALPGSSARHLLGVDPLGRDTLARVVWGARTVLAVAPAAVLAAYVVGCAMGLLAGYYRGWVDVVISRLSDVILSFPVVVLYVILIANIGPSALNIVVAAGTGLGSWDRAHRAGTGAVADAPGFHRGCGAAARVRSLHHAG